MVEYRLYFLDKDRHIGRALDLMCENDEHAIETVANHPHGHAKELWCLSRRVAVFPADKTPSEPV